MQYTKAMLKRLGGCLVGAELKRRKGNHRIVAVGATSRDMGTEWGSASHAFVWVGENLAIYLAEHDTDAQVNK